jgi:hypothetical protein
MKNEQTSDEVKRIAAKGLKHPEKLTREEIQAVCASALTQSADNEKQITTGRAVSGRAIAGDAFQQQTEE